MMNADIPDCVGKVTVSSVNKIGMWYRVGLKEV